MRKNKESIDLFKKLVAVICSEFDLSLDVFMQHDDGYIKITDYHKDLENAWFEVDYTGRDSFPEEVREDDKEVTPNEEQK